ncbi:MAG: hypothetical protein ACI8YQ_000802 [Polaribacter sp.]|jgi:hypothetical protein
MKYICTFNSPIYYQMKVIDALGTRFAKGYATNPPLSKLVVKHLGCNRFSECIAIGIVKTI